VQNSKEHIWKTRFWSKYFQSFIYCLDKYAKSTLLASILWVWCIYTDEVFPLEVVGTVWITVWQHYSKTEFRFHWILSRNHFCNRWTK